MRRKGNLPRIIAGTIAMMTALNSGPAVAYAATLDNSESELIAEADVNEKDATSADADTEATVASTVSDENIDVTSDENADVVSEDAETIEADEVSDASVTEDADEAVVASVTEDADETADASVTEDADEALDASATEDADEALDASATEETDEALVADENAESTEEDYESILDEAALKDALVAKVTADQEALKSDIDVDPVMINMAEDDIDADTYDAVVKALERMTTPTVDDVLSYDPEDPDVLSAIVDMDKIAPVKITEATFPDPVLRSIVASSIYDQDGNGILDPVEIYWTYNLHCEASGVRDLTGAEVFVNLQGLWCKDNYISELDVTPFKDLRGLWCSNNPITEIDITQNKELVWIYCFDCDISELDVSKNPHMAYIEVNTNPKLQEMDVTMCDELEHFTIGSCDLESIDLSHNDNLSHLDIFRNPRLKSLDVTHNPKMKRLDIWDNPLLGTIDTTKNPGLQYYNCSHNNVTSIDLHNNLEINSLNVAYNRELTELDVTYLPKLSILHCEDCAIKSIDLTNSPNIRFFYGAMNRFKYVDFGNCPSLIKTINDGIYDCASYHTDEEKAAAFDDAGKMGTQDAPKSRPICWYGQEWVLDFGGEDSTGGDHVFTVWLDEDCKYSVKPYGDFAAKEKYSPLDIGVTEKDLIKREIAIQTIYELAGSPDITGLKTRFTDVPKSSPYYNAIVWAENRAIAMGYPDFGNNTFGLGKWLTRQDLMFMLMRYVEMLPDLEVKRSIDFGRSDEYKDYFDVDYDHWEAVCWNATWGIVAAKGVAQGGKEEQLIHPFGRVTHNEFDNALERLFEEIVPIPPDFRRWNPPEAPKGLAAVAPSKKGASDGKITGVTTDMEYSTTPDFKYNVTPCTSNTIKGLKEGVYFVRIKEKDYQNPGHVAVIVVSDIPEVNTVKTSALKATTPVEEDPEEVPTPPVAHVHKDNATYVAAKAATCEKAGNKAYYKCSCGKLFSDKACTKEITKDSVTIKALGHNYGAASYKWASDNSSVTATKTCKNDASHKLTEKVTTTKKVIKQPTETKTGTLRYTATFKNSGFATQTKDVEIPKIAKGSKSVTEVFSDVQGGLWYVSAVQFVYDKKIMNGVSDKLFAPDTILTREQFITVLYNMENRPKVTYKRYFTDVKKSDYFADPVTWAYQNEITSGVSDTLFGTGNQITREQLATLLYNYAQYKKYDTTSNKDALNAFPDKKKVSSWAGNSMKWAVSKGVINGKLGSDNKNYLDPNGKASRAECAQMIKNLFDKVVK